MNLSEFLLARIAEDVDILTRPESFQHSSHGYDAPGTYSPTCRTCRQMVWGTRPYLTLQLLALPYSDHPDYRDEWRP